MNKNWAAVFTTILMVISAAIVMPDICSAQSFFPPSAPKITSPANPGPSNIQAVSPSDFQRQVEAKASQDEARQHQKAVGEVAKSMPAQPAPALSGQPPINAAPPPITQQLPVSAVPATRPLPQSVPQSQVYTGFGSQGASQPPARQGNGANNGNGGVNQDQSAGWNIKY